MPEPNITSNRDATASRSATEPIGDKPRLVVNNTSDYSSRKLIIPGTSVPARPANTLVQIDDQNHRLCITSKYRETYPGVIIASVFFLAMILLMIWLSRGLHTNFGWYAYVNPVILIFIFVIVFVRRLLWNDLSRLWRGKWYDEVLCLDSTYAWIESTSQKQPHKRIELDRIKMLGIDDPKMGLDCVDEFDCWDEHIILVLLDSRRVKLLGFPVYSQEEALWVAGVILQRFPQMFDPTVLPDSA